MRHHSHFRALSAEKLIYAGRKIGKKHLVLKGKQEIFFSLPGDCHLLYLVKEAERQNARAVELIKVIEFLSSKSKEEKSLLIKALIMAGKLETAFEKAKHGLAIGWSFGNRAAAGLCRI